MWIRCGVAALNQTPLDWVGNTQRLREVLQEARAQNVSLVLTPELGISGYGCEDAFLGFDTCERAEQALIRLLPHTQNLVAVFGLPIRFQGMLYNAIAVAVDTQLVAVVAKSQLAGDGVHYEPRWFKPWPSGVYREIALAGYTVPLGDVLVDVGGVRLGFEICEDAWGADRRGAHFPEQGVDIVCNASASHFAFGKYHLRRKIVEEGSRAMGAAYLYANLLGNEAGRIIYDGDCLIASGGELMACGRRFSFKPWQLVHHSIDIGQLRRDRAQRYSLQPSLKAEATPVAQHDWRWPAAAPQPASSIGLDAWEFGPYGKEEAFAHAVALGLFDYVRKSRAKGVMISLSGGADSTATLALSALALHLAQRELDVEQIAQQLDLDPSRSLAQQWIYCAYQASANSTSTTADAAKTCAQGFGAEFYHLDIADIVQGYTERVQAALGQKLCWESDDLALQNIQARVRSPSIWMLANIKGAILLSTSNRSEAAVGYATMDGDTSGGLAPIAGIDKAFLRRWLAWLKEHGLQDGEPYPFLECVTNQEPTAELRPVAHKQTDEQDLMPYGVLDQLEGWAIGDKRTPQQCLELARHTFEGVDEAQLQSWVEKFFRKWVVNQWKRERFAPSFHVDDKNLDPKTWCRFPILSAGLSSPTWESNDEK